MNRGLYSTATGMISCQQALDVVANNLANATTTGFKQDGLLFGDMLTQQMSADGGSGASVGSIGSGSEIKGAFTDFSTGTMNRTGNTLDLAIQGQGMFAVQTRTGTRYTRDGSFSLRADGTLVTKLGDIVLDSQYRPIVIPPGDVHIGPDGSIKANRENASIGQIGVFQGQFSKVGSNLYESGAVRAANLSEPGGPQIESGCLESSNVQPILEMVNMIKLTRIFELSQKSIQSQDEATGKLLSTLQ